MSLSRTVHFPLFRIQYRAGYRKRFNVFRSLLFKAHPVNPVSFFQLNLHRFDYCLGSRYFSADESGFHNDFKTVRKPKEEHSHFAQSSQEVQARIKQEIESNPVVVFMKGTPDAPKCGFSRLVVELLREEGVAHIHGIDVLQDNSIREGIKKYSNWPTIPQVFINKEFIGGADILKNLFESGELRKTIEKSGISIASKRSPKEN